MKGLLGVAVLVLTASACASGHPTTTRTTTSPVEAAVTSVSSSRLVLGGNIRITATVPTAVEVGRPLTVTFRIRNVSKAPRKIHLGYDSLWFAVRSPDETTYDTRKAFGRVLGTPFVLPTRLRPGATVTRSAPLARIQWSGPLQLTTGWNQESLPDLRIDVTTPDASMPSDRTAIDDVVASTGGLLDRCRPEEPGVAVTGEIVAPKHSAPPMHARCSIELRRERGFVVAQVLVVSPSGYRRVHLSAPYELVGYPSPGRNVSIVGWRFVVTSHGATSIDSTSVESTKSAKGGAPSWQWTTSGFQGRPGGSHCGGYGGGGGGDEGPLVEFVTACR